MLLAPPHLLHGTERGRASTATACDPWIAGGGGRPAAYLQLSVDKISFCTFTLCSAIDVNLRVWRKSLGGERHHDPSPGWPPRPSQPAEHAAHLCERLQAARLRVPEKGGATTLISLWSATMRQLWKAVDPPPDLGPRWAIPRVPPCPIESVKGRPQQFNRGLWPPPPILPIGAAATILLRRHEHKIAGTALMPKYDTCVRHSRCASVAGMM
jgi:hypothetical protein